MFFLHHPFIISQPLQAVRLERKKRQDITEFKNVFDELVIPASFGRITEVKDFHSRNGSIASSRIILTSELGHHRHSGESRNLFYNDRKLTGYRLPPV